MTDMNDKACNNPDGKEYIKRRILDAVHVSALKIPTKINKPAKGSNESKFNLIHAKDIKNKPPEYLWDKRLLKGAINMLAGVGGTGKSTISMDFAARITAGLPWPDGSLSEKGVVTVLSAEDNPDTTIVPRFMAHGGNTENLYIMKSIQDDKHGERTVNLERDTPAFVDLCAEKHPSLIIIDPVSSYLGKTDSHRNSDVRGALEPLSRFAIDEKVCLLLITHFKKVNGDIKTNPVEKVTGSSAFTELTRILWITASEFIEDENGNKIQRYMFLNLKANLNKKSSGYYYDINSYLVNNLVDVSKIKWCEEIEKDALAKLGFNDESENPQPKRVSNKEVQNWLRAFLKNGPVQSVELFAEAKLCGFSERSIWRAKPLVKAETRRQDESDLRSPYEWFLQEQESLADQARQEGKNGRF